MKSKILNYIPEQLLNTQFGMDIVTPSFRELDKLATIDGVEKRVVTIFDDQNDIAGCAVCFIEQRQYHGLKQKIYSLFGYHLHDYNGIYCKDSLVITPLVNAAIDDAKRNNCDLLVWENIPKECAHYSNSGLPVISEMKLFSSVDAPNGWSDLYNRRSVKRFTNKAKRLGNYHVEIIDGEVSPDLMNELKHFHILRWKFAGSSSPFSSNINRIQEYTAVTSNKHYLRVLINDEILACHYGMRYGKTLLWHTPVINPKFLDVSPLRILLAETAKYCENERLEFLDFGLGDEEYKDGYVNKPRYTYHFRKALTVKGHLSLILSKLNKNVIFAIKSKFKTILHKLRRYTVTPTLVFYESNLNGWTEQPSDLFHSISTWHDFYDFAISHNFQPLNWHYNRFIQDSTTTFIAIADQSNILSYGWTSKKDPFPVGENDSNINLHGRVCLYDFVTPQAFRNKGYYTKLLAAANYYFKETVIYAKKGNKASRRAIERSGFAIQSR